MRSISPSWPRASRRRLSSPPCAASDAIWDRDTSLPAPSARPTWPASVRAGPGFGNRRRKGPPDRQSGSRPGALPHHAKAQIGDLAGLADAQGHEGDGGRAGTAEQSHAVAEEDGNEVDEDLVDKPGGQALSGDVGAQYQQAPPLGRVAGRPH